MNRNQLKYFVAAAETRSFTKAAEQYYISQTAVTQQIHLLEETLGCALFDRSTRPVSLTPAGKAFLLDAKAILERMSRAQERVHDASTGLSGTLRVGYVRGYERSDLSAHIRQFHQQNSNVLITFYRCSTDALAAGLLHHEYDIIFTWDSTNLKTQEGVSCRTVEKARLVVREMADALALELVDKDLVTTDRYGRKIPKHAVGTENFDYTSSANDLLRAVCSLYDRIVDRDLLIRRLSISANRLLDESAVPKEDGVEQIDLFTNYADREKQKAEASATHARERRIQETMLDIKKKYGKNAILKGMNLEEGATAKERNETIGGHQA